MISTESYKLDKKMFQMVYGQELYRRIKPMYWFMVFAILGITIYVLTSYLANGSIRELIAWGPFGILLIIWCLSITKFFPLNVYNNKKNKNLFNKRKFEFHQDRLEFTTENGTYVKLPYTEIIQFSESNKCFSFWENVSSVHIVPFSSFNSSSDVEVVRGYIKKTTA